MKLDWSFSLYDFFGFLVPGTLLLAALAVAYWALFLPDWVLVGVSFPPEGWVVLLGLSYLCGHLAQGAANHIPPWNNRRTTLGGKGNRWWNMGWPTVPHAAIVEATARLEKLCSKGWLEKLGDEEIGRVCQYGLIAEGVSGDREIFEYRRGFYRGVSISALTLAIALLLRIYSGPAVVSLWGSEHHVSALELGSLAVALVVLSGISLVREHRFIAYLHQQAIYGYLLKPAHKSSA